MLIMVLPRAITSWIENKYLRKFNVRFLSMTEPVDWDDTDNTKREQQLLLKRVVKSLKKT